MTLGSEVGTGLADYGRFRAISGAVVGVIIAIILIIAGYLKTRDKESASALMTVSSVTSCEPITSISQNQQMGGYANTTVSTTYNCVVDVTYSVGQKQINVKNVSVTSQSPLNVGNVVSLRYDPNNLTTVSQEMNPEWGYGVILLGAVIGIASTSMAYLTYHSKTVAEVQGAMGLYNLVR